MGTKSYESKSLEDTAKAAADWLADISVRQGEPDQAMVVGLSGHLGAGKTAFVKALAKEMGVEEIVTSPTFVLMKIYETKDARWPRLVHIDAYRLERAEELAALDWERLVADPHNLIMVEWPENVGLGVDAGTGDFLKFEIREGVYMIYSTSVQK